jgi:hypothetical protein
MQLIKVQMKNTTHTIKSFKLECYNSNKLDILQASVKYTEEESIKEGQGMPLFDSFLRPSWHQRAAFDEK